MKYPCDTVKDLLPLYHDDVCSASSRQIVEEHLAECPACKSTIEKLNSETYSEQLREEKDAVIGHYAKKARHKSLVAGLCAALGLTVPILVTLIVDLATSRKLDWFFIVLTGIMTLASPVVVSLTLKENRGLVSMAATTACLYALIAAIGQYASAAFWIPALVITSISVLFAWLIFIVIRYTRRKAFTKAGISVALALAIPVAITMYVNYFAARTLNWSLIVLGGVLLLGCVLAALFAAARVIINHHKKGGRT